MSVQEPDETALLELQASNLPLDTLFDHGSSDARLDGFELEHPFMSIHEPGDETALFELRASNLPLNDLFDHGSESEADPPE